MSKHGWLAVTAIVTLLVPVVIVALLAGWTPQVPKLSLTHLTIAMLAILILAHLLWHPHSQDEGLLESIGERQTHDATRVEDILQMLPHLLPEGPRTHLVNLASEKTGHYQGSSALRGELRRLCAMGLVQPKIGRRIRQIVDGLAVDLAEYVELTPLGDEWVRCIQAIEKAERPQVKEEGRGRRGDE